MRKPEVEVPRSPRPPFDALELFFHGEAVLRPQLALAQPPPACGGNSMTRHETSDSRMWE